MATTRIERTPDDVDRVGLDEDWEVSFWSARFSVTPDELRACVAKVGPRTEDVEARLRDAARQSFRMGGED